ncbi:MAG: Pyruvate:Oxaloacetate transcarboxylase domain protein [Firmicutes bacterium]|nr:Pyruvate:Oxaloacetate transcarboxylase domain protein [Bacillota bacterium]
MNLPDRVDVVEVCPRDGFQIVKDFIRTEDKIEIIKKVIDAGVKFIEITSYVHPKWVPQMADAGDVVDAVKGYAEGKDVELIALVPNKVGAVKAFEAGLDWITYVVSASESHNMKNINRTIEQSFAELEEICAIKADTRIRLAIATTFGCPFGEEVPVERVIDMAKRGLELGVGKVVLADTIGIANPVQVKSIIGKVKEQVDVELLGVHLHDTRGMGLANTYVAVTEGIRYFESAVGGLGGCPFAPGAAGNIATEDMINMFHSMGVETGVAMDRIFEAVSLVREKVNSPVVSHMANVCRI